MKTTSLTLNMSFDTFSFFYRTHETHVNERINSEVKHDLMCVFLFCFQGLALGTKRNHSAFNRSAVFCFYFFFSPSLHLVVDRSLQQLDNGYLLLPRDVALTRVANEAAGIFRNICRSRSRNEIKKKNKVNDNHIIKQPIAIFSLSQRC